jgi:uncharacterized protein YkwD
MDVVVFDADSLGMTRRAARLLAVVALVLSATTFGSPAGARVSDRSGAMRSLEAGILVEINTLRREHGLVTLRLSSNLSRAARRHSTEMAARGYFSHSSADGSRFDRRIAGFYPMGSRRYWSVGENLLWSSPNVDAPGALQMWLDSPEHRKNMLTAQWRELGISAVHSVSAPGTFSGREVTIVTTDFGVRR